MRFIDKVIIYVFSHKKSSNIRFSKPSSISYEYLDLLMSLFCDQTTLKLKGGNGGKGCVSFRREKKVPRGGPDGGDGGNGGNIYLKVNDALNSLIHLDTYKHFQAPPAGIGGGQQCHGKNGKDLYLEVPQGTIVRQIVRTPPCKGAGGSVKKTEISDLSTKGSELLIGRGGKGGFGNAHFVSSIRQAPHFAELGEEGEEMEVELELKLVADIGIIGVPSAGKSSLISVMSNARPKIAAYPFTTLIPNLGVVKIADKVTYVVADIPGLIEGAHEGKGLGIAFLKHVQRCRLLVHLIDPTQPHWSSQNSNAGWTENSLNFNKEAAIENFALINQELEAFSKDLAGKQQIVVINKSDVLTEEQEKEFIKALKKEIGRKKRFIFYPSSISCATTKGVKELKTFLFQELEKIPKPEWMNSPNDPNAPQDPNVPFIYRPHLNNPKYFTVEKVDKGSFRVTGKRVEQIMNMTDFNNVEARNRAYDVLYKMHINRELKKIGAREGDTLLIGKKTIEFTGS